MGKRRKRLTMTKYAKKYASIRAAVAKLKGVVEEAESDGVITSEEAGQIVEAEQEVVEAVISSAAEEIAEVTEQFETTTVAAVETATTEEIIEVVEKVEETAKPTAKKAAKKKASAKAKRQTLKRSVGKSKDKG
jgi:hypothetical protein